ncbi:TonB-dependent receptor [Sphingobium phenoxybenzoativorans]|uniref:TonB-dependent receptor n=1 Tax=Sphingobium phenoxybenzoativorans TaxID=1592790 RepID=UPI000872F8D6|nr:TonB-dependent receptor [Sphingobium phenoxybenzoativorans]
MRLNRYLFVSILATTSLIGVAQAQEASQGESSSSSVADQSDQIADIIVTAQFRQESAQSAAIPISVVDTSALTRAGVSSASQLTTIVPALQVSQGGAGTQAFYLRGVGNTSATSLVDPGVAFNVDGVYIGRPTSVKNTFFDLERVEVLKGPQGTLYGRNATGGAINVIPVSPKIGETGGYLTGTVGNYDTVGLSGAVNVGLSDISAARVAFTYNEHDGYLSDGTNDEKGYAIRAQLLVEPSPTVKLKLSADYAHSGGNGTGSVITGYLTTFGLTPVDDPLPRTVGLQDPRTAAILQSLYSFPAGRFGDITSPLDPSTDNHYWGVRAEINHDSPIGALTAIASYRESSLSSLDTGTGFPSLTRQDDNQFSLEARLASPDEGLIRYLLGGYYYTESIRSDYNFNVAVLSSTQNIRVGTDSLAGFGRLTVAPTDSFRIIGGARLTHEKKPFSGTNTNIRLVCTLPGINQCPDAPLFPTPSSPFVRTLVSEFGLVDVSGGTGSVYVLPTGPAGVIYTAATTTLDEEQSETRVTWRAGVEYDLTPSNLLYASVETGYHAGGFSFSDFIPTFGPETVTAYTIGTKNSFLGNKLRVNMEFFYWIFKDQQVSHFADDGLGNLSFVTENAGKSKNYGFEVNVIAKPARYTTLNGDIQYLNAKYDEFSYLLPSGPTSPPPVTGCPFAPAPGISDQVLVNCSGFDALRSPKWTINLGAEQVIPVGTTYELVFNADFHYQTRNMVGFEMLPGISEQEAYTTTNAAITFRHADANWAITAFIRNIENEHPIGQSFFNNQLSSFASSPLPPRTYGATASIRF